MLASPHWSMVLQYMGTAVDLFWKGCVVFAFYVLIRRLAQLEGRTKLLELKTGWLHVERDEQTNRATVTGQLSAQIQVGKENGPYAS